MKLRKAWLRPTEGNAYRHKGEKRKVEVTGFYFVLPELAQEHTQWRTVLQITYDDGFVDYVVLSSGESPKKEVVAPGYVLSHLPPTATEEK